MEFIDSKPTYTLKITKNYPYNIPTKNNEKFKK